MCWVANSPKVLSRRAEAIREGDFETVILLEYRYRRLTIPKDLRPTIGLAGIAHLGFRPGDGVPVYIVLARDEVSLVSQEYRDRQMDEAEASGSFAGLP